MNLIKDQLSAEELKSKLFTKMNEEGKLDVLRASMRSEVIKCFYSDKKLDHFKDNLSVGQSTGGIQLEVLNWLVEEHLKRNRYEFSRSIFNLETKHVKRQSADQLNIVEVMNHLGIELMTDTGRNVITSYANINDSVFLWHFVKSSFTHTNASPSFLKSDDKVVIKNEYLPGKKNENDIINSLHRRLKQIDDFYNERKLSNFPNLLLNSSENEWTRNDVLKINDVETDKMDSKNDILQDETDFQRQNETTAHSQKVELLFEKKRLEKFKDELEIQERQLNLQRENYQQEHLLFEKKCRDLDFRNLHLNAVQQRLENREKQLEIRERQHLQLMSEYKKLKADLNNDNVYGHGTDYLSSLRKEYEGKLNGAQSKIRYLQNKIHLAEEIIQHDRLKHHQQCEFYNEQLKLQRDRITFLHKAMEEVQMFSHKHQFNTSFDPFYSSNVTRRFGRGDSVLLGVDLQETYFDTSLNASQLAPELELGKHLDDTLKDVKALDLRSISTRLRELENEAEELEYNYSKLDRSDKYFNDEDCDNDNKISKNDVMPDSSLLKHERKNHTNAKKEKVGFDLREVSKFSSKIIGNDAWKYPVTIKHAPNSTINKEIVKEDFKGDLPEEELLPSNEELKENLVKVESAEKSYILEGTLLNATFTVPEALNIDIFEKKLLESVSSKSKHKTSEHHLNDSVRSESSVGLTPRSSTPVEGSKLLLEPEIVDEKDERQSDEISKNEQHISWEKISGESDNEFEW